jgi:hypothetical protein
MDMQHSRARICGRLRSLEINSKESIPPAYIAWRAGTSNWVVRRSLAGRYVKLGVRQAGNRFLGSLKEVYKFGLCCLSLPLYICSSLVHTYLKAGCSLSSVGERGKELARIKLPDILEIGIFNLLLPASCPRKGYRKG